MDILNSKVMNIEGRLYINYFEEETFQNQDERQESLEFKPIVSAQREKPSENAVQICKDFIKCPNALFKYVIGYKGQTIKRLREETGTKIEIPKGRNASDIITVTAKSPENLEAAITRIELLLSEKRWKEQFGFFVSIPLTNMVVKDGFRKFRDEVLRSCEGDRGLTDKLFQNEDKIHLTIETLILLDESECAKAIEVLKRIQDSDILETAKGTNVSVLGVEYMNDDPKMVDVVYAKVSCPDKPDVLQNLADYIASEFEKAGLAKKEYDYVKLHATVMNTIRTMGKSQGPQKKGRQQPPKRETFDASNVLNLFHDYYFGEFPLNEIHISKRHSTDKNGYYESLYVAEL